MLALPPTIAVVTQPTRLQGLVKRWSTRSAARFHVKQAALHELARQPKTTVRPSGTVGTSHKSPTEDAEIAEAAFAEYDREDLAQRQSIEQLKAELDMGYPLKFVEQQYLPSFDFRGCVAVVVVGQDGLVANTAKYVGDTPIVAVNPDPTRIDGILLPFRAQQARLAVKRTIENHAKIRRVTLARERKIKENELNTEIAVEQKKRQIRETQMEAEIAVEQKKRQVREVQMQADIAVEQQRSELVDRRTENDKKEAEARGQILRATLEPLKEVDWRTLMAASAGGIDAKSLVAMAFHDLADNAEKIGNLNVSPELLNTLLATNEKR